METEKLTLTNAEARFWNWLLEELQEDNVAFDAKLVSKYYLFQQLCNPRWR